MSGVPAPPIPPRLDRWPAAVRSAELLRGAAVRCGPGVRLISWPETPAVRAAAISRAFEHDRVAARLTAAWIWGAAREPGTPLRFIASRGRLLGDVMRAGIAVHEYRLEGSEIAEVGGLSVTTPVRTVYDLLRAPHLGRRELVACRCLLGRNGVRAGLRAFIAARSRPYDERVRLRLEDL